MSDWNSLETQLRSWKPRPPSPELKARIFAEPLRAGDAVTLSLPELWRWIVPALGCLMLVLSSLTGRIPQAHFAHLASTNLLPLGSTETHPEAAYLPQGLVHCEQNSIPVTRVELRFGPKTTPARIAPFRRTNALIQ